MATERTVHVVDDDADVLRSLERLLLSARFTPVLYKSAFMLMDAASRLSAGCPLLDVQMPGMDGLELQAQLNDRAVRLPVIVMTAQGDVSAAVRAMKAGAVDFIEKPSDDERLLAALESALAGVGSTERDHELAQAARRVVALSRRERQVLAGLVAGHPNKVIAYEDPAPAHRRLAAGLQVRPGTLRDGARQDALALGDGHPEPRRDPRLGRGLHDPPPGHGGPRRVLQLPGA